MNPVHYKIASPEKFDGDKSGKKQDVSIWLWGLETYLRVMEIPVEKWVDVACAHLKGAALGWYRKLAMDVVWGTGNELAVVFTSWTDFKTAIQAQFQVLNAERKARDELARLRQTRSVQEYVTKFRELMTQLPGKSDEKDTEDRFLRGLKDDVARQLEMMIVMTETREGKKQTLEDHMALAERMDSLQFSRRLQADREAREGRRRAHVNSLALDAESESGEETSSEEDEPPAKKINAVSSKPRGGNNRDSRGGGKRRQDDARPRESKGKESSGSQIRCYNCDDFGHISRECPKPDRRMKKERPEAAKAASSSTKN